MNRSQAKPRNIELREGGIYALTDRREFVVRRLINGTGYLLYYASARQSTGSPEYRVHEDGRLAKQGRLTHWRVAHLRDTGRTAVK